MEGYAFLVLTVLFSAGPVWIDLFVRLLLPPDVQPACKVEGGRGDTVKTESRPRASLQGPVIQEDGLSGYILSVSRLMSFSQTHHPPIFADIGNIDVFHTKLKIMRIAKNRIKGMMQIFKVQDYKGMDILI